MNIVIKTEKENPLLKRKELKLEIKHPESPTPSEKKLLGEITKKFSVDEDHIIVDYIFTKKGISESTAKIKIYEELVPKKPKEKKEKPEEKPPEKPKKEVKEEKKSEEPKKEDEKIETQTNKTE
jgi:small subunit ribosomal protein S24e